MQSTPQTICQQVAHDFPGLEARMRERERLGLERYGRPLDPYDGRDWIAEAREELADALVYLTAGAHLMAEQEQDAAGLVRWVRLRAARRKIADLLADLGDAVPRGEP